ncbi:hypothetical protein LOK49_LG12G01984 [Camellia lanceoleosa]|uniref:Uncharacterized protein n=1 Tax=Camellia lanceoleosa TaxID=1840588 RepID=A0ACC0FWC9_9ERIC|nr:hypothetical protein LOK49_LG12G01984 [Camellia lanceoleosa]
MLHESLKISHLHYNLTNLTIEELISSPKASSLEVVASDISVVIKQLLELTFKTLQLLNLGDAINKVISSFVSAASSYDTYCWYCPAIGQKQSLEGRSRNCVLAEGRKDLLDINDAFNINRENLSAEYFADSTFLILRLMWLLPNSW